MGGSPSGPRPDVFPKKYQRPVLIDDMEFTLQIRLIERRAHAPFGQIRETSAKAFKKVVDSFDIDIKGLVVPKRFAVLSGRAFQ